jgi:hypothetical protein
MRYFISAIVIGEPIVSSRLIERGWLRRVIELKLVESCHVVEYDGRGMGETLKVDGDVIHKTCWYWFVPRFESKVGGYSLTVDVRIWPWLTLRSLVVNVGGQVLYAEGASGAKKYQVETSDDWDSLI